MSYRKLLLAVATCTGLLVAFGSIAMPINGLEPTLTSAVSLIDHDKSDSDDNRQGLSRENDDDGRQVSNDCRSDDDDDGCDGRNGAMLQQNDTAPANGLFTPGSKPKVQLN